MHPNGVDQVCSLRKILTRLRGTTFCTTSARFAPSFVKQPNGPKCTQMVRNAPKCQFRVQWGGSGAFVPRSRVGSFHNERTRSTPLDAKLMFWCISYRLRVFGTVKLPYETQGKTFRTSPKVRATQSRQNFSQRTHPIDPIGF